ncbi:peptidoglycan-binding domain-containing protein [Streptomyces sp. C11-1]|uniref:Peptidoglycan-binding domain-containing protein n=1 Tax=Streptomyces durocortorensis TaxID=2811104 RepID=A0ABY9W4L0_9ACTN|nr:peptidoglycan-binding domain-containing protein [Streptomyces durocortorensis]WNF31099.1 peptidoglycan-binding domain-containing protein [Streptomyces durocortorensis]
MKLKLAALGAATVMLTGLGAAAPAAVAAPKAGPVAVQEAEFGALAAYCSSSKTISKSTTTYIHLPATSGGSITCEMSQGANGIHVKKLQRALVLCYGRSIAIDGAFGPATYSALKYAQGKAGTAADGIYGPNTRDAIKWPRFYKSNNNFTGYCAKR